MYEVHSSVVIWGLQGWESHLLCCHGNTRWSESKCRQVKQFKLSEIEHWSTLKCYISDQIWVYHLNQNERSSCFYNAGCIMVKHSRCRPIRPKKKRKKKKEIVVLPSSRLSKMLFSIIFSKTPNLGAFSTIFEKKKTNKQTNKQTNNNKKKKHPSWTKLGAFPDCDLLTFWFFISVGH